MFESIVYNSSGESVKSFFINDDIEYVDGRVHKGKRCYYKGVGVPYRTHFIKEESISHDYAVSNSAHGNVFYAGYVVSKKNFINKKGIFLEPYQPFFPDAIGSCSIKEGPLVMNSVVFERSSVEIFDCIEIDVGDYEDRQFYYELDYKCKRKTYLNEGDPHKLTELLNYMIASDWNFLWDKATIKDVSLDGRVTDVADLFISNKMSHKLGSIYSVLYSLSYFDQKKFLEFLSVNDLEHKDARWFVFNAIKLLERNGIDVTELNPGDLSTQNYKELVIRHIVSGKNCAYCSCDLFMDNGDSIRNKYIEKTKKEIRY